MSVDREQALDAALGHIERQFGKGAVMKMNDHAAVSIGSISTGSLALVDPQPFEAPVQILGETACAASLVAQHEHPDASGLAVALRHHPDRTCACGGLAQCREDRLELVHRAVAEEGQRDVQVVAGNRPTPEDVTSLPVGQGVQRLLGETDGAEQARALTACHASREAHAALSRVCSKSRRTRWSAVTVARRRIDSRSPGKTKSALRCPSGPATCT